MMRAIGRFLAAISAVTIGLGVQLTPVAASSEQEASGSHSSAVRADPCGFRSAAWDYVQFSADFIAKVEKIPSAPESVNSADAAFYKQALRDAILDMGS